MEQSYLQIKFKIKKAKNPRRFTNLPEFILNLENVNEVLNAPLDVIFVRIF